MSDRYSQLVRLPVAGTVAQADRAAAAGRAGARRAEVTGRVLLGGAGRVAEAAARVLAEIGAESATALDEPVRALAAAAGLDAAVFNPEAPGTRSSRRWCSTPPGSSRTSWSSCSASSTRRSGACCRPAA